MPPDGVKTASGGRFPAELVVWAAGIKAPDFLKDLDGLETNRINQLVVRRRCRPRATTNIFAIGDCAAVRGRDRTAAVPPRAQAAHQQASHLVKQLSDGWPASRCSRWSYRDFGSLVSLGEYSHRRQSDGRADRRQLFIEGCFARLMYMSLYKMHELRAARLHQGVARHARALDHAAHRAARQAALRGSVMDHDAAPIEYSLVPMQTSEALMQRSLGAAC